MNTYTWIPHDINAQSRQCEAEDYYDARVTFESLGIDTFKGEIVKSDNLQLGAL